MSSELWGRRRQIEPLRAGLRAAQQGRGQQLRPRLRRQRRPCPPSRCARTKRGADRALTRHLSAMPDAGAADAAATEAKAACCTRTAHDKLSQPAPATPATSTALATLPRLLPRLLARQVQTLPRPMAVSSLIALVGVLALVVGALLRTRATDPQHLHLAPKSTILLEHMCLAAGAVVRSGHSPLSVTVDLSSLPVIGDSTLRQLDYACAQWASAGAQVTLMGCLPEVAAALWRRSVRAHVEVRAPVLTSTMLH